MDRNLIPAILLSILILSACNGKRQFDGEARQIPVPATELDQLGVFNASLPADSGFDSTRVPAVSSLAKDGEQFHEASSNVGSASPAALFDPQGELHYAIRRFEAAPLDSIGSLSIQTSGEQPGFVYWAGIANYDTGRWQWLGGTGEAGGDNFDVAGEPGMHSSGAGYIYVAIISNGNAGFAVDRLTLEYLNRYDISGHVLDYGGHPIAGALVTTNLADPRQVFSAEDGSFSLPGIPNGSWSVFATVENYLFDPLVNTVGVSNADVEGLVLRGEIFSTRPKVNDPYEPNDIIRDAHQINQFPVVSSTLSVLNDAADFYSFDASETGWHYLEFRGDDSILFPTVRLQGNLDIFSGLNYDSLSGAAWFSFYIPQPGSYFAEVRCEAGGGEYELHLQQGRGEFLNLTLFDNGAPGDGDDGLQEAMDNTVIELEFAEYTAKLLTPGEFELWHYHIPPLPATVRPVSPRYTFEPASIEHDFSSGQLVADFNFSAVAPADSMEPNDDFSTASPLSLPLAAPLAGFIGGNDLTGNDARDVFSFSAAGDEYVLARVRFPEDQASGPDMAGNLRLFNSSENTVQIHDMSGPWQLELRSRDPLAAGDYYLQLDMGGTMMAYELELFLFEGRTLSSSWLLSGNPLSDGQMHWQTGDGNYTDTENVSSGTATVGVPLMEGEFIKLAYERNGMAIDPPVEWIQLGAEDRTTFPKLTIGSDSLEPNALPSLITEDLELPVEVVASISSLSDEVDCYRLGGLEAGGVAVNLKMTDPDTLWTCMFYGESTPGDYQLVSGQGDEQLYYRSAAKADYILRLSADGGSSTYSLDMDMAGGPVYSISGSLDHGTPGDQYDGGFIVNQTTGRVLPVTGPSYDLGFVPEGSYDIQWYIANHLTVPLGAVTVVVNGADAVQDFTASYQSNDSGEPNNSTIAATPLSIPISTVASLDFDDVNVGAFGDGQDYYKFTAPGTGSFELTAVPWLPSLSQLKLELRSTADGGTVLAQRDELTGVHRLTFELQAGQDYVIHVTSDVDIVYQLAGDYLP